MKGLRYYLEKHINKVMGKGILENVIIDSIIIPEEVYNNIPKDGLILEKKDCFDPIPGVKHYTCRIDPQLGTGGPGRQRHMHLFYKGKEFLAMNADATAHDGYHHMRIPQEVIPFLKSKGFVIPPDNLIEIYEPTQGKSLICESVSQTTVTKLAVEVGEVARNASEIAIIESNLELYYVRLNTKVSDKYKNIKQIDGITDSMVHEVKIILLEVLKGLVKYNIEDIDMFDDKVYSSPHSLFIAWN